MEQRRFASGCCKTGPWQHSFTNSLRPWFAEVARNRDSDCMNDVTARVLLVDDDARLRELLLRYLQSQGFEARGAGDAVQMQQTLDRGHYDLIVLDLMLPGEDGLQICRRLRGLGDVTPIVMLTAKGDEIDRIVGLEIGADDYLPKPVNPRELVARIKAVLRRTQPVPGAPKPEGGEICFGEFKLDLGTRELLRDGTPLRLTSGEFAVLATLLRHPRQPLSRDRLMSLARGREHDAFERSIDVTIARLRRLLEQDPRNPRLIQTVWGTGYVYVPPGEVP
jgi:two-component system, OmpR family, phosphate regulon response regulator OmpR